MIINYNYEEMTYKSFRKRHNFEIIIFELKVEGNCDIKRERVKAEKEKEKIEGKIKKTY